MTYYVRVSTRSSGAIAQGSPRQALDYITDSHDQRRDSTYSDAELAYIARMDPGWKTDQEGGRVPLTGHGALAAVPDGEVLEARFEDSCQPYHDRRGTTGYKGLTFTLPKEVSLFAEGHRSEAQQAITAAVRSTLDRTFKGFEYSAVSAIHTRNQAGEIHYHAHVLVGKFARNQATGKTVSLNSLAGGNTRARMFEMKKAWQAGLEKELLDRLKLGIEQRSARGAVTLTMPSGERLEPLNRDSRRVLEKEITPRYTETSTSGKVVVRQFRWSAMDDRIFEIASSSRGMSAWNRNAFKQAFPEQAKFAARYEARVKTLKAVGYLTPEGKTTPAFRLHFCVHHGVLTPELQALRLDLQARMARDSAAQKGAPSDFWSSLQRYESLRHRVERLGYSRDEVNQVHLLAARKKPTPELLAQLRAQAREKALVAPPPKQLPQTKTIIRAYVDLKKAGVQRVYLLTKGAILFWRFSEHRALANKILDAAKRDLFYAKEKRVAQLGRALRPVFWLVRVTLPREARRIEKAIERCTRLAHRQEIRRVTRDEVRRAYQEWKRDFVAKPLAELKRQAADLERPPQQKDRPRVEEAQEKLRIDDLGRATAAYLRGYEALARLQPEQASKLQPWVGKEDQLVTQVLAQAKGEKESLSKPEYDAAIKAGRVGNLLELEKNQKPLRVPAALEADRPQLERLAARLRSLGVGQPFTADGLRAVAPSQVRNALKAARDQGLLDDGPAWTLKASAARAFCQDLTRELGRGQQIERSFEDRLLQKRPDKT